MQELLDRVTGRKAYALLLISLFCIIVYARTLDVPFYFDDYSYLVKNPIIRSLGGVFDKGIIAHSKVNYEDVKDNVRIRTLSYFTLAINYYFNGTSVAGYHAVNIAIHMINAWLIYLLILLTGKLALSRALDESKSRRLNLDVSWIAFFTAMIFAVHPVMTSSVTYIIQRAALLVTLFYLLTIVLYSRSMQSRRGSVRFVFYGLALLSCLAAMRTKEIAFTLPLTLGSYDAIFCPNGNVRQRLIRLVPFLLTLGIIPFVLNFMYGGFSSKKGEQFPSTPNAIIYVLKTPAEYLSTQFKTNPNQTSIVSMSPLEYLFTQFRVIVDYQKMLLVPTGLAFSHDYPFYRSLADPAVLFSLAFHLMILSAALYCWRLSRIEINERAILLKLSVFGVIWFYLTLAVESSIVPIDDIFLEYRMYLPAFGYVLALVTMARLAALRWNGKRLASGLLAAIIIIFSALAIARNEQWRDPLVFWQDALAKSPRIKRIHGYIGNVYRNRGDMPRALQQYRLMLADDFRYWQDHFELGKMFYKNGFCRDAVNEYLSALKISPDKVFIYEHLSQAYRCLGEDSRAIRADNMAVQSAVPDKNTGSGSVK